MTDTFAVRSHDGRWHRPAGRYISEGPGNHYTRPLCEHNAGIANVPRRHRVDCPECIDLEARIAAGDLELTPTGLPVYTPTGELALINDELAAIDDHLAELRSRLVAVSARRRSLAARLTAA